jgi:anti-sigma-K factor RskA
VPKNAVVAVTVEPAGGSQQPTTKPFFVSPPA